MDSFRYILRYFIDNNFHEDDRIKELALFCNSSRIQEVMLFLNPEELFEGHVTEEQLDRWLPLALKIKKALAENEIDISINPWTTTVHVGRGRKLHPGQKYSLMRGENGIDSTITVCPLDENWINDLCRTFSRIAAELDPVAIWLEDDWRLHNHGTEMGYGGCFCEKHMSKFSKHIGQSVSREELIQNVLSPGKPHPWRKEWLKLCRDTLLEPAVKLQLAVKKANPRTRLALMSSCPDVHSIEGRDWHALQEALAPDEVFMIRPHMPPYTESWALHTTPARTRHTLANLKRPLEIYPELESSPRNGPYTKSRQYSIWECLHSACIGANGITINHFDMLGNGIMLDSHFGEGLNTAHKRLDAIAKLKIDDNNSEGADILFSPEIAAHMNSTGSTSFSGLINNSVAWSNTLYILGISHRFTKIIEQDRVCMLSGQTLRTFDDAAVHRLLSGKVILDADSVDLLLDRGMGKHIGVKSCSWHDLNNTGFAYEEITDGKAEIYGLECPRMTAQRCSDRLLAMSSNDDAEQRSMIMRYDRKPLFPGMQIFKNSLGGIVAAMSYPMAREEFYMGFFNSFRRIFMQRLFVELNPFMPIAFAEDFPMHVYRAKTVFGTFVAALNSTSDTIPYVKLNLNNCDYDNLRVMNQNGGWDKCSCTRENSIIKIAHSILPLDGIFLLFEINSSHRVLE